MSRRILVVEDHEDSLTMMCRLLSQSKYVVTAARTCAEARLAARAVAFDVALIDIGLPDGDGCDLMAELRRDYGLRGIAVSGYGMAADVARCRSAGFHEHIVKPFDLTHLREVIAAAENRQPSRRAA